MSDDPAPTTGPTLEYEATGLSNPTAQLTSILLRILAVLCFLMALPAVEAVCESIVAVLRGGPVVQSVTWLMGAARYWLIYVGAGAVLLWKADRWGARLAPKSIGQSPAPKFNSYEAQAIAFSVLGVYIVVQGIALLWQDVVKYFLDHTWRSGTGSIAVA